MLFPDATSSCVIEAAVGWALTLLSHENLSYASTCQTIGLNTGYFASFTVFLAFNSREFTCVSLLLIMTPSTSLFSDQWGLPHLSLSAYLKFWGVASYLVTMWLLFFKKEVSDLNLYKHKSDLRA